MTTSNNGNGAIAVRFPASMTAAAFTEALGMPLPLEPDQTFADALADRDAPALRVGDTVAIGETRLAVVEMQDARVVALRVRWPGPRS